MGPRKSQGLGGRLIVGRVVLSSFLSFPLSFLLFMFVVLGEEVNLHSRDY